MGGRSHYIASVDTEDITVGLQAVHTHNLQGYLYRRSVDYKLSIRADIIVPFAQNRVLVTHFD